MQGNEDKVVQMHKDGAGPIRPPVTDFWFAQVDVRLGQIERMVRRLEWQVWLLVCGSAALLLIEVLRTLSAS